MQSESTVYFRGINLSSLVDKYLNNEFVELLTPIIVDVSAFSDSSSNIITIQNKSEQAAYEVDLGMNKKYACIGYKVYDSSKKYNCMNCIRPISNSGIGIPIAKTIIENKKYYHMIDIFCTWECMYKELLTRADNKFYLSSIILVSELYALCTGKDPSKLQSASDKRLLEIYNGQLSWEEYHSNTSSHITIPDDIMFLPSIEYIEQDFSDNVKTSGINKSNVSANPKARFIFYLVSDKSGKYSILKPNKEYHCMNCLDIVQTKNGIGIPIVKTITKSKNYYHMIDIFCTWECMYAELIQRLNNALYNNSIDLVFELYANYQKDISVLQPASDKRLLEIFNGPISLEEYHFRSTRYSEKPGNILLSPVLDYIHANEFQMETIALPKES